MSRAPRIIIADADSKNASLLAYGFEREGIDVTMARAATDVPTLASGAAAVVLSVASGKLAADGLRALRSGPTQAAQLPVLAVGEVGARTEVIAAGATDYLPRPTFVRDVVALARFLTLGRSGAQSTTWTGDLADFAGPLYLVRALSAAGRTGVMTLIRGLRRAELRFYQGEVTSAQVGSLHGMAAMHQLVLWTEGKLDFRAEAVVRRQQIPLEPARLFDDLGRFLRDFHDLAPELSPGTVLEQDLRRVAECVDKIPKEVNPVLRLFDGNRSLCDVVEDSPFRVFETVKVAARLEKLGAIRVVTNARQRAGAAAALKVEDWLVGQTPPSGVPVAARAVESQPVGTVTGEPASPPPTPTAQAPQASTRSQRRKSKRERSAAAGSVTPTVTPARPTAARPAPAPVTPPASSAGTSERAPQRDEKQPSQEVDWGTLPTPTASVWDVPGYAPVVPSQVATGEIGSRPEPAANLATVGHVVADDLTATNAHRAAPSDAPSSKVLVDSSAVTQAVVGVARERVEDITAPVPRDLEPEPALGRAQNGPARQPVAIADVTVEQTSTIASGHTSSPASSVAPASTAPVSPPAPAILASAPVAASAAASASPTSGSAAPVSPASVPVLTIHPAPTKRSDSGSVQALSGALETRPATIPPEPKVDAPSIVVVDPSLVEIATTPSTSAGGPAKLPDIADERSDPSLPMLAVAEGTPVPTPVRAKVAQVAPTASVTEPESSPSGHPVDARGVAVPEAVDSLAGRVASAAAAAIAHVTAPATPPEAAAPETRASIDDAAAAAPSPAVLSEPPAGATASTSGAGIESAAPAARTSDRATHVPPAAAEAASRGAADAAAAAAKALAFDAIDEEFFAQEHQFATAKAAPTESFDDLEHGVPERPSFWQRLLSAWFRPKATPEPRRPAQASTSGPRPAAGKPPAAGRSKKR